MRAYKDFHRNRDCVILSCGPSLDSYTKEELQQKLKNKVVIVVKQAYFKYPHADYHCWNCCNLPVPNEYGIHYDYQYQLPRPIVLASSNFPEGERWSRNQIVDHFYKIPNPSIDGWKALCFTQDWDNWTIEKTDRRRPLGPGIMYETVFYLAVHLGVKKITTIGWDLGGTSRNYGHFQGFNAAGIHNPGYILDWEVEATRKASKSLYYWLQSKDIDLEVGEGSNVYEGIPRVTL